MKSISTFPTFSVVTLSFAGMALFAVIDQVEAGKGITASGSRTYSVSPTIRGGVTKPPTTGTVKANPPRIVREHGDEKVFAPPRRGYCRYPSRGCYNPSGAKIRDHRQHPASAHPPPRVVPNEGK
ncbi:MAG TPA: hypothetical protein VG758_22815 [Hyphomicrobiaceae bacterium]|jgi:hypothetical protein|nr:hypothetical protein [Hyphomicrobiaceae bacterium]